MTTTITHAVARGLASGLLLAVVSCKSPPSTSAPSPSATPADALPSEGTARATAICQRLVAKGVAKICSAPTEGRAQWTIVYFELLGGFPKDRGQVTVYFSEKAFHGVEDPLAEDGGADDYPNMRIKTPANVGWGWASVGVTTTDGADDAWDLCRAKRPAAACAKAHQKEYEYFRSLTEVSRVAIIG